MSTLRISLEPHASEDLRRHVSDHLDAFNVAATGHAEYHSVSVFLRDDHGEVLGGRQLLAAAERYAVERGCTRAWLTTFSFQAPEFYPKLGYETFAVLEDHPLGHRHHFLQKRLAAPEETR
jgi:GNAT superfamily N-acetyltransferase